MFPLRRTCFPVLNNACLRRSNYLSAPSPAARFRPFYAAAPDGRLKASLESPKFAKTFGHLGALPRYARLNSVLSRYNVSLVAQSLRFSTSSASTIEVADDEVPDDAKLTESTMSPSPEPECSPEPAFGTFEGAPLLGEEHGAVYSKHEPTMFGDWSHMGRVTDF